MSSVLASQFYFTSAEVAEIIARKEYTSLVAIIDLCDPTPQELASCYFEALQSTDQKLEVRALPPREFDREKIIAERADEKVYQQELKVYRSRREEMLISF